MNLFATILTHKAPAANYRGENVVSNRLTLQRLTKDDKMYVIVGSNAIRSAMREALGSVGCPVNRTRKRNTMLVDEISVQYKDLPNPEKYADDHIFGYMIAAGVEMKKLIKEKLGKDSDDYFTKKNSILSVNKAVALTPFEYSNSLVQAPNIYGPWTSSKGVGSSILNEEFCLTAFQYPFALQLQDQKNEWVEKLLEVVCQLNGVGGNHARSFFSFEPASLVFRLTKKLAPGYNTYCFEESGNCSNLVNFLLDDECKNICNEFYFAGEICDILDRVVKKDLESRGVSFSRVPENAFTKALKTLYK